MLSLLLWLGNPSLTGAEDANIGKLRDAGMVAYRAGNYAAAKQAFDQAYALAPLHSLGLWSARARVQLGEWLQADERYEKLSKTPLPQGAPGAEAEARDTATREREQLRHRIPRVRIRLEGVNPSEVEVRLNGALVADEFLIVKKGGPFRRGKALPVNPGTHQLIAVSMDQRKDMTFAVEEAETRDVNVRFANPDTLKQRKCRDQCRADCRDDNDCYVACKQRCFTKGS